MSQSLSNASLSKKGDDEATVAPVAAPVIEPVVAGVEDDPAEELGVSPPRKLSRELAAAATSELGRDESMLGLLRWPVHRVGNLATPTQHDDVCTRFLVRVDLKTKKLGAKMEEAWRV